MRERENAKITSQRGQALVEFALVSPMLFLMMLGILEFGFMFQHDVAITNAARSGARWAATHPTAWSNASAAPSNSIEGQVQYAGGTSSIPNDDSHLVINYLVPGGGSPTVCGHYSASSGSFVANSGYTQGTCVVAGTIIQVQVTSPYTFITPFISALFPGGIRLTATGAVLEES